MSSRTSKSGFTRPVSLALALGLAAAVASAQYPGQIVRKDKDTPELRSVAVLEWTGDEGKPKTSRIVPITVYDGQALQDGGVYLARPQPLALAGEVEYELEKNGAPSASTTSGPPARNKAPGSATACGSPCPPQSRLPPNPYWTTASTPMMTSRSCIASIRGTLAALTPAPRGRRPIPTGPLCIRSPVPTIPAIPPPAPNPRRSRSSDPA